MINLVRKIVAGPKNRTVDQEYDLDLTYITDHIIAMAFPAAGLEKAYRNSIDDVVGFLKSKHGSHYLIINASNRKYSYEKFDDQVLQFFWTDHQAPPLTTLFQVCEKMMFFLQENDKNVVAVHCNHGKGRTGTAIIAYLLYSGQFNNVKTALKFYNEKRFSQGSNYGVDQPCQLRYLNYFNSFLQLPFEFTSKPLKAYKLTHVSQKGLNNKQLFVRISETRTEHVIYPAIYLNDSEIKFARPLIGDIFIQLLEQSWSGTKQLLRINFHLFFLLKNMDNETYQIIFIGDEIKMKHGVDQFQLTLEFQQFCLCHQQKHTKQQCLCASKRQREQNYWQMMLSIMKKNKQRVHLNKPKTIKQFQKQQAIDIQSQQFQQL